MIRNGITQTYSPEDTSRMAGGQPGQSWAEAGARQYGRVLQDMHADNPAASMMVCMGLGFGVGFLLANVLEGPTRRLFHQEDHRNMAERLGSKVMDSLNDILPRSLFGK